MSTLAWHGFACELPAGWEVTGYRLDSTRGEFRFHERLHERGRLSWVQLAGEPDLDALARGPGVVALERLGPWVVAAGAADAPSQAFTWIAHDQRLVQWTLPAGSDHAALTTFTAEPGDCVPWALFGAAVRLPRRFAPLTVDARPGEIRLDFADPAGVRVTARRFGLARCLLAEQPLEHWAQRSLLAAGARIGSSSDIVHGGVPARRLSFTRGRLPWRRMHGEARWWHDPARNQLRAIEQCAPRGVALLDLSHAH